MNFGVASAPRGPDATPWEPAKTFRTILWRFTHLRSFGLEADDPSRRDQYSRHVTPENPAYIQKLQAIAEEMVSETPWLRQVKILMQTDTYIHW
ncbi:hypothetical protein R3P38DRAFT_3253514 [Favolaschia claudopus]|uniref:Uncharacterized protein n=1 Tax=Favolaschia claudopus TaxID=2862362 RepID=A0AAW0DV97_9AGAR